MPTPFNMRRILLVCSTILLLDPVLNAQEVTPKTFAYTCINGENFTAHFKDHHVRLYFDTTTVKLPQVRTASGVKFEDKSTTFWAKGNEAMLMRRGASSNRCSIDHNASEWESARLDGADFRGFGDGGKWTLLTFHKGEGILLTNEYGTKSYTFKQGKLNAGFKQSSRTLLAENGQNSVAINLTDEPCTVPGSEQVYPTKIYIILNKMYKLRGCGKALTPPAE